MARRVQGLFALADQLNVDKDPNTNEVSMTENKPSDHQAARIEILKLKLERAKYRSEIFKWIAVAIGAAVSFAVIDYGKLQLEKVRLASDNQLKFIEAYSKATEAAEPEIW